MTQQHVLVRFFAGAAAAAGAEEERVALPAGADLGALLEVLAARGPRLERVLTASTFLLDGVSARRGDPLPAGAVVDVLPPFAGG